MSIDATILGVDRDGSDVVLTLGPRIDNDDRLTLTGQDRMRILDATYVPEVGTDLWGDAGQVELCSVPKRRYHREGYTRLRELEAGRHDPSPA